MVVPIEDTEQSGSTSEPARSPVRTDLTKQRPSDTQDRLFEETSIPLPGTPTSDYEGHVSVTYKPGKRSESGQLVLNMDGDQSPEPDSPNSSRSFSSRGSTKSTDVLLPKEN